MAVRHSTTRGPYVGKACCEDVGKMLISFQCCGTRKTWNRSGVACPTKCLARFDRTAGRLARSGHMPLYCVHPVPNAAQRSERIVPGDLDSWSRSKTVASAELGETNVSCWTVKARSNPTTGRSIAGAPSTTV